MRNIYRPQWSGLTSPDLVWAGLRVLEEHDLIWIEEGETGGRPSGKVRLQPGAQGAI